MTHKLARGYLNQSIIIFSMAKRGVGGNGARCVGVRMMKRFLSCTPLSCWLTDQLGSKTGHSFQLNRSHASSPSHPFALYVHVEVRVCECVCVSLCHTFNAI